MKRILFLLLLLNCLACKTDNKENIQIVIDIPISYRYDLIKEEYTVFFNADLPLSVKFSLSLQERKSIIDKFYALKLNRLPDDYLVEDKCYIFPKLYDVMMVRYKDRNQKIKIDSDCDNFNWLNPSKGKNAKEFIDFVIKIIKKKPGVSEAPLSDIIYM